MMIKKLQVLSMLSALNFAVIDRQKIVIWEATRTVLDTGGQILKKLWHCISGGYYKIIWFIATQRVPVAEILSISTLTGQTAT